jgi:hypothetical protein
VYPFDPVTVRKFLTGMFVRPASMLNVGEPAEPEMNSAEVLTSCEKDWPPLKIRKFDREGRRPFCVNATARTVLDAAVFCTNIDLVTNSKLYDFVWPRLTFEDVTNGTGEI